MQRYEQQTGIDPAAVVRLVTQQLEIAKAGQATQGANQVGELYAQLAAAQGALENHDEAHVAAIAGLALLNDTRRSAYINLIMYRAGTTFDAEGTQRELTQIESLRKQQISGSPAEACLLTTLANLELQAGHPDKASIHATRAYHISRGPARQRQRAMAADALSIVVRDMRDFEQALKLNQEVIDWDMQRGATFDLATSRFVRGSILRDMRDHKAVLVELQAAQQLAIALNDVMGIGYNNLLMCMSNLELGNVAIASGQCEDAHRTFVAEGDSEPEKLALESLAQIDVKQGKPARALVKINRILDGANI
jgi:tetratricopeptide (TPR) repeat protein